MAHNYFVVVCVFGVPSDVHGIRPDILEWILGMTPIGWVMRRKIMLNSCYYCVFLMSCNSSSNREKIQIGANVRWLMNFEWKMSRGRWLGVSWNLNMKNRPGYKCVGPVKFIFLGVGISGTVGMSYFEVVLSVSGVAKIRIYYTYSGYGCPHACQSNTKNPVETLSVYLEWYSYYLYRAHCTSRKLDFFKKENEERQNETADQNSKGAS